MGRRAEDGSQRLGGLDELLGSNGIVLFGIDGDVNEGALEGVGVEEGATRGDNGSRHDGGVGGVGGEQEKLGLRRRVGWKRESSMYCKGGGKMW